ncbi:MAG TPA: hypothetical protein PKE52_14335 [Bacteroidales bacterium]|nr:hypothetical protein [Bacteroidales bacterium]
MVSKTITGVEYSINSVTVKQALELLDRGARMIDVRSLEDSSKTTFGHCSLERIPILDLLDLMECDKLDRDGLWIIVDMDGELARKGANMLLYNDFKSVCYLAGGLLQWGLEGQALSGTIPELQRLHGENSCCSCSCHGNCDTGC